MRSLRPPALRLFGAGLLSLALTALTGLTPLEQPVQPAAAAVQPILQATDPAEVVVAVEGVLVTPSETVAAVQPWYLVTTAGPVLTIDPNTLPDDVQPGSQVTANLAVPSDALPLRAVPSGPVSAESQLGSQALAAISQTEQPVALTDLAFTDPPARSASATNTPARPILDIVMASPNGDRFFSEEQFNTHFGRAMQFWVEQSRGQISGFEASYNAVKIAKTPVSCGDVPMWEAAASAVGHDVMDYILSGQSRMLIILTPHDALNCSYAGVAYGRSIVSFNGVSGIIHIDLTHPLIDELEPFWQSSVIAHEMGHIFGMVHAGGATCPNGQQDGSLGTTDGCSVTEYGDNFNVMGNGWEAITYPINAFQKRAFNEISTPTGFTEVVPTATSRQFQIQTGNTLDTTQHQAVFMVEEWQGVTREYAIELISGKVQIRRVKRAGDTSYTVSNNTVLLPDTNFRRVGDVFTTATGRTTVTIVQLSTTTATIAIQGTGTGLPAITYSQAAITGTAQVGQTITATVSGLLPSTASSTFQWLRDGQVITQATGQTFTLTADDLNRQIAARITLTNTGY
ncbi:MAG: hypothetical protein LBG70_05060, partial [Bifidobacteriaceae bacterium]|nr:hypothetical protein [Bifidobacteriaceae bacterium]